MAMLRRFRGSLEPLRDKPDYGENGDMNPYARTASVEKPSTGCLMAVLPEECNALIKECGEKVDIKNRIVDEDYTENGISDRAHVTIKYGICDETSRLEEWCGDNIKPFKVIFTGADVFKNEGSWVLVMKCGKDAVADCNQELCKVIPHIDPYAEYTPHMTICYMKPETDYQEAMQHCNETFSGKEYEVVQLEYSDADDKTFFWNLNKGK